MSRVKANDNIHTKISTTKESASKKVIFIVTGIVVVVLALVILYFIFGREDKSYNTVVTPDNVEEVKSELDNAELTPIGQYEVVMNTKWTFPDSDSPSSNAYVENSVHNQHTVFFTIAPKNDSKKEIYKSPNLEVGSKLQHIKLSSPLGRGKHDCVLKYHLLDKAGRETSSVSVSVTITMEK